MLSRVSGKHASRRCFSGVYLNLSQSNRPAPTAQKETSKQLESHVFVPNPLLPRLAREKEWHGNPPPIPNTHLAAIQLKTNGTNHTAVTSTGATRRLSMNLSTPTVDHPRLLKADVNPPYPAHSSRNPFYLSCSLLVLLVSSLTLSATQRRLTLASAGIA